MITIFKNIKDITNPNYISIDVALNRIKNGKSKERVEEIRTTKDSKRRSKLKSELPSVCFSGEFSERKDECLKKHSGFVILDFDHLDDVASFKTELTLDEYIYACWVSPSGDGLKALVKIPAEKENHEGYYLGLLERYPQLDSTSKNLSRVCYESYDPDIFIDQDSKIWETKGKEEEVKIEPKKDVVPNIHTDYNKVNQVLNIIRNSVDGEKHYNLLKASRLAGGFIAGGDIDELTITNLIEQEIFAKGVDDEESTRKTIQDGIDNGKGMPIEDILNPANSNFSFLSEQNDEKEWLDLVRKNKIPQGYDIGSLEFDNHFRLKKKTIVGIFGSDNVGKTTFTLFLLVAYAKRHNLNFLMVTKENNSAAIRQKIMEVYCGRWLHQVSDELYNQAYEFANKHFDIINNNFELNQENFFEVLKKAFMKKNYFGVFVDPYNSIQYDSNPKSNYAFLDKFRAFQNKHDMSFLISMHISTEKARNWVYSEEDSVSIFEDEMQKVIGVKGQPKIPRKNFVEGGQPVANKLDDVLIIHRVIKIQELRRYTMVSVDKVKEEQTGGMQTFEAPILFRKVDGYVSFEDSQLKNPLYEYQEKPVNISTLSPNEDFDNYFEENHEDVPF